MPQYTTNTTNRTYSVGSPTLSPVYFYPSASPISFVTRNMNFADIYIPITAVLCKHCNNNVNTGKFCSNCGKALIEQLFVPEKIAEIEPGFSRRVLK